MNEIDQEQARKLLYAFLVEEGILFRYIEICRNPIEKQLITQDYSIGTDFVTGKGWCDTKEGADFWSSKYCRWRRYLTDNLGIDCVQNL